MEVMGAVEAVVVGILGRLVTVVSLGYSHLVNQLVLDDHHKPHHDPDSGW